MARGLTSQVVCVDTANMDLTYALNLLPLATSGWQPGLIVSD